MPELLNLALITWIWQNIDDLDSNSNISVVPSRVTNPQYLRAQK
jgi:hypothetical protein